MESKLTLVVALYIHPGRATEFERFESAAAEIMKRHGVAIERRIAFTPAAADTPHEVHVVSFPDAAAFARYRADAELQALADLRDRAIRKTVVWTGADLPPFSQSSK
jgi:uncharacterized protein (DUF1330 family)